MTKVKVLCHPLLELKPITLEYEVFESAENLRKQMQDEQEFLWITAYQDNSKGYPIKVQFGLPKTFILNVEFIEQ